ncbi:MAG TPA: nuclear transport factor 2 family protein [Acidimicrobiia bacterium]|nr:nuclear transport factor 2 family protein [Acidimicrobiia bacterium]
MDDHPNAAMYRQLSQAMSGEDLAAFSDKIADDVEWWEIGATEPIRGKAALMERMQGLMGQGSVKIDLHDVVANDQHMVALVTATAERDGRSLTYRTAEIYHVRDGKLTHRWAFSDDTAAINAFFA